MDDGTRPPGGTTRQLWILRHAQARPDAPAGGQDRDRTLTSRGRADAAALGERLAAPGPPLGEAGLRLPTVALVSAAARTVATADLVCGPLGDRVRTETFQSLYGAGPDAVLGYLREVEGGPDAVLVVGHNPTVSYLALDLLAPDDPGRATVGERGLVTCALAVVDLGVPTWAEAVEGTGALVGLFGPPHGPASGA